MADEKGQSVLRLQGYSYWVDHTTGKPIQVCVAPDRTKDGAVMFGYAFDSQPTPDRVDKSALPCRHPQSFYFSGFPMAPANAPIVSQNYISFAMIRPDPKTTWDQVNKLDPRLFQRVSCSIRHPAPWPYKMQAGHPLGVTSVNEDAWLPNADASACRGCAPRRSR
jgi:hypothetical protein